MRRGLPGLHELAGMERVVLSTAFPVPSPLCGTTEVVLPPVQSCLLSSTWTHSLFLFFSF